LRNAGGEADEPLSAGDAKAGCGETVPWGALADPSPGVRARVCNAAISASESPAAASVVIQDGGRPLKLHGR
jgi:hypothetical protein